MICFTALSNISEFEYLWSDDCWSNELERVWKEAVVTCSVFNDSAFVWRKEKTRGNPKDNVCPNWDSNRSPPKYKSGILSVTTFLEKLVFGQLVAKIPPPPCFGTRRLNAVFTRAYRSSVLWARWIQSALLHSCYCWRRSTWPEKLFILWPAIKRFFPLHFLQLTHTNIMLLTSRHR